MSSYSLEGLLLLPVLFIFLWLAALLFRTLPSFLRPIARRCHDSSQSTFEMESSWKPATNPFVMVSGIRAEASIRLKASTKLGHSTHFPSLQTFRFALRVFLTLSTYYHFLLCNKNLFSLILSFVASSTIKLCQPNKFVLAKKERKEKKTT